MHTTEPEKIRDAQNVFRVFRRILAVCAAIVFVIFAFFADIIQTENASGAETRAHFVWPWGKCTERLSFEAPAGAFSQYQSLPGGCLFRKRWNGRITLQFGEESQNGFVKLVCISNAFRLDELPRGRDLPLSVRARSCEDTPVQVTFHFSKRK